MITDEVVGTLGVVVARIRSG